jgi:hypothetical protein
MLAEIERLQLACNHHDEVIAEQHTEVERLTASASKNGTEIQRLQNHAVAQGREIERLRGVVAERDNELDLLRDNYMKEREHLQATLQFYADANNYTQFTPPGKDFAVAEVLIDNGAKARRALGADK